MSESGAPPPPPPPPPQGPGGYGGYPPPPPSYGYGAPQGATPPPNYLVWSILTTIFCCLPLGIVSIVFAAQVNSKWTGGDYAGAQNASQKARQFAIWSAVVGVVVIIVYLLVVVSIGAGSGSSSSL